MKKVGLETVQRHPTDRETRSVVPSNETSESVLAKLSIDSDIFYCKR